MECRHCREARVSVEVWKCSIENTSCFRPRRVPMKLHNAKNLPIYDIIEGKLCSFRLCWPGFCSNFVPYEQSLNHITRGGPIIDVMPSHPLHRTFGRYQASSATLRRQEMGTAVSCKKGSRVAGSLTAGLIYIMGNSISKVLLIS